MEQVTAMQARGRGVVVLGIALVAAAALGLLWWVRGPAPADHPSLAVLPFDDAGGSVESAWLAPGIQDELTTLLSRLGTLRVVSRNATERYARSRVPGADIGRELDVAYLLSGEVRRAGDSVRVAVNLRDAASGDSLWSETLERPVAELFSLEGEIARATAEAAHARRLTPTERNAILAPPTSNPAAYEAFVRARSHSERTARDEADILDAIAAYESAVRLDPGFAAAWAQLARRHSSLYSLGYDRTDARAAAARQALETAERLAPQSLDARTARAYWLFVVKEDLGAAERAVLELEREHPGSPDVATGLAQITRERGQLDRSAQYARRAIRLDPLDPYRQAQLCQDYVTSREFVLALQTCDRARSLLPSNARIVALLATIHQARGELAPARALVQQLQPAPGDWRTWRVISRQFELERDPKGAVFALATALDDPAPLGTRAGVVRRWLADAQRQAGDAEAARASYAAAGLELEARLAEQPSNPVFLGELAIVRARLGDGAAARDFAQRCARVARASRRSSYIADCGLARLQVALATAETGELPALLDEALKQPGALPPLTVNLIRLDPDFDAERAMVRTLTPD